MSDNSVPEADGVKWSEKVRISPAENDLIFGAQPKFKRKRSFYRALRRGAVWAWMSYSTYSMARRLELELFGVPKENWRCDKWMSDHVIYLMRKYE